SALACWLSGSPLEGIHLWRRGPLVSCGKPTATGRILLGLLPLAAGFGLVLFAHRLLAPPLEVTIALPTLDPDMGPFTFVLTVWRALVDAVLHALRSIDNPLDPRLLAFIWIAASALLSCAGRLEQWKVQTVTLLGGWALLAAFAHWGIGPRLFSRAWFAQWLYGDDLWRAVTLLVLAATLTTALLLVAFVTTSLLRATLLPRSRS
ncbi:MAG: hypothetical protein D6776_00675, partial [Planctomycetota bacterium]